MNCRECQKQLSDYVDDRLDASQRQAVDGHLGECAECKTSFGLLERARRVLASEGPAEVPGGLAERAALAAFAAERAQPARSFFDRWIPVAWPAAAVSAAAAVLLLLTTTPRTTRSSAASVTNGDPVRVVLDDGDNDLAGEVLGVEVNDEN